MKACATVQLEERGRQPVVSAVKHYHHHGQQYCDARESNEWNFAGKVLDLGREGW